ncbi:hypothetical protein [Phytohabitans houttuyneae]|uniref:CBM-cenC domain-containing protein n=1 Tax=Phytohabitans houttuyneae TaxID=1076126 RepID=A0A6V8KGS2_9ACTN|nr:hypothetical protein [Phytohabitans houttuyneae]GFJ80897.1 hypothetical protein Phou_050770 [Phytohabitans houttuyneae]
MSSSKARPSLWGRLTRAFAGIALATVAVVTSGAAPASAEAWPVVEGFESRPFDRWSPYINGQGNIEASQASILAHSGVGSIFMYSATGSWVSIERRITLDRSSGARTCGANIWASPQANYDTSLNLEVIDAATWTYVSVKNVPITGGRYQQVQFANFAHTDKPIVVRIVLSKHNVNLDDFQLWCSRPLS